MKNIIRYTVLFITLCSGFSCTTIKVAKVEPGSSTEGLRYSLGKPFIKVTPNPGGDGTYTAELIYLPDNNRTYAVSSSSFMSKHTMELNVDGAGILSKISLSKDATANVSEGAGALGELAKTEIARKQKEAEEEETKIEAEIKENQTALKTAVALRDEKQIASSANDREIAELEATSPTPLSDEVKEKLRVLRNANFKLDLEIRDLDRKIKDLRADLKKLDAGANIARKDKEDLKAYGPVFFAIKEEGIGENFSVKLELVKDQEQYKTVAKPAKPANSEGAETAKSPILINKKVKAKLNADGSFDFLITFDKKVERIEKPNSYFLSDPVVKFNDITIVRMPEESFKVQVPNTKTIKPGKYVVTIEFFYAASPTSERSSTASFVLTLEK